MYNNIVDNFIIQIIPNANPQQRFKVESGEWCLGFNETGFYLDN